MSHINMNNNASYNFKAPNITEDSDKKVEVVFPTVEKQEPTFSATQAVTIKRQKTILDLGKLTGASTVNLTIGDDVELGAELTVVAKSDTTARDVTMGTGFLGGGITGVISKTFAQHFVYNGVKFVAIAAALQLD